AFRAAGRAGIVSALDVERDEIAHAVVRRIVLIARIEIEAPGVARGQNQRERDNRLHFVSGFAFDARVVPPSAGPTTFTASSRSCSFVTSLGASVIKSVPFCVFGYGMTSRS